MANNDMHVITVGSVYLRGGYVVKCKVCGKIGRGIDEDRKKAKQKAWTLGGKHRINNTGKTWPGA